MEKKASIFIATLPYSGNSTGSSLCWPTAEWLIKTMVRLKTEEKFTERVSDVWLHAFADTPVTMVRNSIVRKAQEHGATFLLMVDSDMWPDCHVGEHEDAVPFLDAAFDCLYDRYEKGPHMIAAPYGGSPPHENMFVFDWESKSNLGEEAPFEVRQYTRNEAMQMAGVHECAALPTGLIMYDMRCFDLIHPPYFKYEWTDETESQKASTEDVQNTRDISLAGIASLGYNPCLCAWSSWAGHMKVWRVGKPNKYTAEMVCDSLKSALERGSSREKIVDAGQLLSPKLLERFNNRPLGNGVSHVEHEPA